MLIKKFKCVPMAEPKFSNPDMLINLKVPLVSLNLFMCRVQVWPVVFSVHLCIVKDRKIKINIAHFLVVKSVKKFESYNYSTAPQTDIIEAPVWLSS